MFRFGLSVDDSMDSHIYFINLLAYQDNSWLNLCEVRRPMVESTFNEALVRAIDFAFGSLGDSCKKALFFHLDQIFRLQKQDMPARIKEFNDAILFLLKDGGKFLETLIVKKLCEDLGVSYGQVSDLDFLEALVEVKSIVSKKSAMITLAELNDVATNVNLHVGDRFGSED